MVLIVWQASYNHGIEIIQIFWYQQDLQDNQIIIVQLAWFKKIFVFHLRGNGFRLVFPYARRPCRKQGDT